MKKYVKKQITSEVTVLEEQTCDLCGAKAKKPGILWSGGIYDVDETEISVTIRQRSGENYPDNGSGTEHVIDLCPKCFKERLIPWLRSQGATIEEKEWDW